MPALIFPAPGYTAVDSSSILSTATWCSSDSLGSVGKLKTRSTIVASVIKLDVPKVSLSRKLTTDPVNFTPNVIKRGFQTKSVNSSILTTSTNRLESTVNTTTFVYTQTSVTTTLAPITARERLYYAQIAPGKYGQILTYNSNKVIDVVSSQLKSSVLSKPISVLISDRSNIKTTSVLAKPITILRPDNSRIFNTGTSIPLVNRAIFGNKLPRTYTTSSIKTVNIDIQLPITGQSGSTADTVSWYINDQDILTVVSVGDPLVTLYFARSIYAPVAGSTVRLINSNIGYSKQISVISATDGSITFTDPGDLPSISSMYIATVTSQNIIDYVTTVYLDNSTKIFDAPSVAKIKTVTSLKSDSNRSIGVENTNTKFSRLESTVNTTTFVYTQTSVSTTLAPTTARGRLYYAQIAPGKYGQILTYNGSSITQGILAPGLGKTASVAKLASMSSMVSRATLQKPIVSLRPDSSYPSKIYVGTDTTQIVYDTIVEKVIGLSITSGSGLSNVNNLIDWLEDDTDILNVTNSSPATPLLTLYIDRNSITNPLSVIRITNDTYTTTASVVSYTANSITVIDPGTIPSPLDVVVFLYWNSARSITTTALSSNDNNKTASVNKAIFGKKIPKAYTTATVRTVTTDIAIPITGSSGSTADTVSWYINDQDILTVIPQGSQLVTLYFARTIYSIANTVTLSSSVTGYDKKISVISSTDGSVTFTDPGDLPSISSLSMVITTSRDIIDYSTVAYLDSSTEIFDTPKSSSLPISPIKLRSDNNQPQTVNTVKTVAKLLSTAGIDVRANLQKPIVSLRSDNNQRPSTYNTATQMSVVNKAIFGKRSTRAYTTATVRTITTDIAIPITGISGSTADTVSWYINDQDILTVIPQGSQLVTLYFARTVYSIGSTVNLLNSVTGYDKKISVISSTDGSVTFTDPGDLPSIGAMSIIITTSRDIIDYSTVAYLDSSTKIFDVPGSYKLSRVTSLKADTSRISTVGKTNSVTRLIGKTTIGTSGNLQKSVVSLKSDNNQRSGVYNTATQISLVNKVTFGSRIPRAYTTTTIQTISIDTVIPVTGSSGSTADTVGWYINDQDILTVIPQESALVTLYFVKQPQFYFTAGSSVKLLNYLNGYSKQVTVISSTDGSITFTDPGDIPSISGLQLIYTETQTVFRTVTNSILENVIEIFNSPKSGNLSKSLVALRADSTSTKTSGVLNKPIVSLRNGPPLIPTPGKVSSAIILRPDGNQRSGLYTTATRTALVNKAIFGKRSTRVTTTSTIRTVITDIAIPVTGISVSKSTADTVSWYINDQDILTVVPVGSSLVTFFFNSSQLGSNIRITNGTGNYIQSISVISITNSSITFSDPGDLPGIGEMYILSSTTQNITDYQTYSYLDSGTQMFDVPTVSKLSRAISVKSVPAQIQTIGKAKIISKLVPSTGVGIPLSLQKQFSILKADNNQRTAIYTTATQVPLVNKVTFGGRFPRAYITATTTTIYVDTPWPITGRSGSTADTVAWYINDQDILTTTNIPGSSVTLYFAQQNLQTLSPGLQVRLVNWTIGYTKLVTLTAATNASITFADPGDLPSISGMNILLSVPRTVTENSAVTYYDNGNKIFDIPTISTLARSSSVAKLVAGTTIGIPANLQKPVTALRADNNQRSNAYNTATQIPLITKAIFGKKYTRAYTTSTLNLVTTDVQIPVVGITGSTADTVSWYINDQDILTVIPQGSALVTLYFAKPAGNVIISNSFIKIINSSVGYSKQVSVISSTEGSITFTDPGDLPSLGNMFIIGTTSQYVVDYSTVTYLDNSTEIFYTPTAGNASFKSIRQLLAETVRIQTPGKASNISKLIAGTNVTPSANLQKQFAVLKADNNQRTTAYSTTTQIPLVARAIFGKKSTRAYTTATTRTVTSDIAISITGISGSTADTVSWYINDQDILTVIPLGSALVTLYFAKSSYDITGTVKLINTNVGYSKQIAIISSTDGSITFINPGDLPSISGMYIVTSTTQSVIDYATYAYLDSGTQMFDVPRASKLSVITQLKSDSTRIRPVGRTSTVNKLIDKTSLGTSGNLQKPIVSLRPDSSYPSKTYVSTDTTQIVYDTVIEQVIRTSTTARSGISDTNNLVDWFDDETDILTITDSTPAVPLLTIYIDRNSIVSPQPTVEFIIQQSSTGLTFVQTAAILSYTANSITVIDTGTIPSPLDNRISLYWKTARSVITASLSSNDLNKNPSVNKVTFGGRIPRAYTTSTTSIIYVDTPWPVTGRSGSTADTVNWYIYDQDILNTAQSQESTVTLYFAQQNLQTLSAGLQIRLLNWTIGYTKLVTLTAATNASITFVDPGDLPSISGLSILLSVPRTIVDNSSITQFESNNELVDAPKLGNLSKSSIILKSDSTATKASGVLNKPLVKLISSPSVANRPGKVTSGFVVRSDNNQRSSTYNTATQISVVNKAIFGKSSTRAYTTATTRTVTTDIQTAVISRTGSTADTVSWYINDQDILTVIPEGSALVTFYFATAQLGSNIRIINPNIGYTRSITVINTTPNSITFTDPGDLPSISGMYIVSSTTQTILDYATYTYLDNGTQMFDVPRVSKLSRAISVKADTAQIRTVGKAKTISKLTAGTSVGIPFNIQKQLTVLKADANQRSTLYTTSTGITLVNKAKFGTYIPRPYTSSVTRTVYVDTPWPITGRDGSTADTVNWYIYDQDILNTGQSQGATVTLYFAQQNLQTLSAGLQIRLISWTTGYTQLVTLIAATNSSITFTDPGDLPSISGLSILLSVPSTITDFQTTVALESGSEMFSTPKSSNLVKSSLTVRAVPTVFQTSATVSKNLVKLVSAANVSGLAKLTRSLLVKGIPFTASTVTNIPVVNKAIFGKRVPQAYTSATTRTIYTDIQISIIGITGSTADTVSWYINDQDILTVIPVGSALVTLYFAKQNQNYFSVGSQVRVFNSNIGYNQLVTLTSFTDGSITFVNPGDLPSISGMYVVVTQSQNVIDYITVSNLDYSTSIFSIPTVNSLIKSQIQIRSPRTISSAYTLTNTANRLESTVNTTTFVYTQTSVTTTLAPTTARERLYYAQVAPGRYGKIITYNGSSLVPGGILSTATNRLESTINTTTFVYTQTSVTTTLAPTNARERLYYAQLAAGKYGITLTYNGRSIAPGGILSTATNRLESTINTTTFVYTQTSVTTTLAPTTARERLYYAQIAAGKYGVTVTYNGRFLSSGLNVPATDAFQQRTRDNRFYGIAPIEINRNLEFFNDTNLMGEISFPVRYQIPNVLTTSNSISAYIYDYDILTYSTYENPSRKLVLSYNSVTAPSTTSTNIKYIPFAVGSTVKISSKKLGYLNTFTVLESNYDTVTVSNVSSIPLLGDTDDLTITGLPSVYPISSVFTTQAPTTARENLYYFNISPGLRSGKNLTVGEVSRIPNAAKLTSSLVVKALPNNLSASVTGRIPIKLSSDSIRLTASKLTQAATRLQSDQSSIRSSNLELIYFVDYFSSSTVTTSTFVVPTASIQTNRDPQNPREVLYYAQMGPGVRNRGITLTAFGKQAVDISSKLSVNTLNKNISPLKADSANIIVGKTSIPSMLVGRPSLEKSGNLQKSIQILKADSFYPTKSYTAIDTTSTVYDTYSLPVIARSGHTADTVNWYINDQDVLTVTEAGFGQVTLYFAPSQYSLDNSAVFLIQTTIGYSKQISSYTYTNSSITFDDPGDLPNVSGMIISWSKPRTVISTAVIGIDNSKTPLINKAIFGKKLPQARVSSVTRTINVDAYITITAVSRTDLTADTVNWYINDNDILTVSATTENLVTLFFDKQNLQIFAAGDVIRLADYNLNYIKQVTVVSATPISVTFTDPGDLVSSLKIVVSTTQTITDSQTTTYLDNSTAIFESPTSSNLVKSLIKLRSDVTKLQTIAGKVPFKLADGPLLISRPGKVTSTVILRPDSGYSSPSYTSTSTTSVVYDSYYAVVTGSSETGVTTDVVSWYIEDRDILTVVPSDSKLLTLFFDPIQDSLFGLTVTISHGPTNYYRVITNFTFTRSSITFLNPGDIFSTSGMILTWTKPRTLITATAIGQDINKIPLVTKALFGKKLPQARVSSVTRTIDVDILLPVIGRSSTESTADTVNWYLTDQDILNTEYLANPTVTLYLAKQNVKTFTAGNQIRVANYQMGYVRQFIVISATDTSITFNDPGDLPEISSLNIIVSVAKTVTDFQTNTYLENTTEVFESPKSSNLVKSLIKLRSDVTKLQTMPGKTPLKVVDGPPDISRSLANLQKPLIQLRPDSSYSSPSYTSTSTTSVVYDNHSVAVTGSSRNLSTADTVSWYINDQDVLTVIPVGVSLVTLYFAPGTDSMAGVTLQLFQLSTGYSRTITSFSYTTSSITFADPGDLPSTSDMTINWSRSRTTVTANAIGQDINKIPLVTKAIFGKKLPQARVSSVTKIINIDAPITVTAISRIGSTADTVDWYINDSDILTTGATTGNLITLSFDRQNLQIFSAGDIIRLADYGLNYIKQVTVVLATPISVTFTDPGDLVSSSNNLKIIVGSTQTVTDFQTTTYLNNSTEIFESPTSSNLVKSSIKLRSDTAKLQTVSGKVPLKVADGPPDISRSLANLQKSLIQLRPDSSYSSPSYTSTSTTSVTYDNYSVVVTGSSRSLVTADTVDWYINDQDVLTVIPIGGALVTLYFTPGTDSVAGATLQLFQARTGYSRIITSFSYTTSSITFIDPGDLPSEMTINWSRPKVTITDIAIGQNLNKIPLVEKAIFGKKLPRPRTVAVTNTIYVDNPIPVLTVNRPTFTADTVAWYIEDRDILTTSSAADSTVTLIFARQTLKKFTAGEQIRLADYALNYVKQVTVIDATDTSVTFTDPGDLVTSNSLNILVSVAQTVTDSQTATYLDSSIEIFDTPKISNLAYKQLVQLRAEPAVFKDLGKVKIPLKLIPTGEISTTAKLLTFSILKSDRTKLSTDSLGIQGSKSFKLADDVSIKLALGSGQIIKLRTGNFKLGSVGIQDPAAQKKEPIQFWN